LEAERRIEHAPIAIRRLRGETLLPRVEIAEQWRRAVIGTPLLIASSRFRSFSVFGTGLPVKKEAANWGALWQSSERQRSALEQLSC
jgi:hypothetical protein